jgi:hypothetical protein
MTLAAHYPNCEHRSRLLFEGLQSERQDNLALYRVILESWL